MDINFSLIGCHKKIAVIFQWMFSNQLWAYTVVFRRPIGWSQKLRYHLSPFTTAHLKFYARNVCRMKPRSKKEGLQTGKHDRGTSVRQRNIVFLVISLSFALFQQKLHDNDIPTHGQPIRVKKTASRCHFSSKSLAWRLDVIFGCRSLF